jgi:hypothetical protein
MGIKATLAVRMNDSVSQTHLIRNMIIRTIQLYTGLLL